MKFGMRKPSLKKSISARTKGRLTRQIKRALIPGYGKRGMGWLHPKRAMYNRVYRRTTFGVGDVARVLSGTKTGKRRTGSSPAAPAAHRPTRAERSQQLNLRLSVLSETEQQEVDDYVLPRMPKKRTAYILCILTGILGGHRYYLKSCISGVLMVVLLLVSPVLTLIWWLIDLIRLSGMVDDRVLDLTDEIITTIEKRHLEAAGMGLSDTSSTVSESSSTVAAEIPVEAWYPADTEKFQRNEAETEFLRQLYRQVKEAGLSPSLVEVQRLSDGTLKCTYGEEEMGRVRLQKRKHTLTYWQDGTETVLEGELPDFLPHLATWIEHIN